MAPAEREDFDDHNTGAPGPGRELRFVSADLRGRFIGGMAHAAATVSIVTTDGAHGRAGVTVSAMTAVSADMAKPTLLVCVHHKSSAASKIMRNGVLCVNVLRDEQAHISEIFAGRLKGASGAEDKFACARWTVQVTGAPRVVDPLVAFDCTVVSSEQVGTHYVFIGAVEDIYTHEHGLPLIYSNRSYGAPSASDKVEVLGTGGEALSLGCLHTLGSPVVPPALAVLEGAGYHLRLLEGDHRRLLSSLGSGEIDMALLYNVDLGDDVDRVPLAELRPYVLLGSAHPLAGKGKISLSALEKEPLVLLDVPPGSGQVVSLFTERSLSPQIRYRSASLEMVRGLVRQGLGYSILAHPTSQVNGDGLCIRELSETVPPAQVVLACRKGTALDETKRVCCDAFRQALSVQADQARGGAQSRPISRR